MLIDDLDELVVDQFCILLDPLAVAFRQVLQRRHRVGQDLRVVLERLDHAATFVEIMDAGHAAHALADIGIAAVHQPLENPAWHEMGVRIDLHSAVSVFVLQ